ncbi:hypothetical protein PVK06_030693 [Gossypium arboreum]|uniref:Uncharacterized protein n=1 Tax=Gossypium arboreum TaxID=29729 RepID=A0ABR0NNX7_GOSAR|nr:hypothetical protein PVK06_030693 [Gossypium arboreum]
MLNLTKFLKDDPPTVKEGKVDEVTTFTTVEAWKHSDFLCRNYILSGLSDALYEVYSVNKISKELWTSLDHKYKVEGAGTKKFLIVKFLNFVMVDSKLVVNQVQELQLIIHGILVERMIISESFQVAAIIDKLPPTYNDFKNYLKHKRKEMSVEYLIVRLRIEEDNREKIFTPETRKIRIWHEKERVFGFKQYHATYRFVRSPKPNCVVKVGVIGLSIKKVDIATRIA